MLYRHHLELELEGSYFDVLKYFEKVEGLAEQLYWDEMHFTMEEYPLGILRLEVHTLSTSEELIGVYY